MVRRPRARLAVPRGWLAIACAVCAQLAPTLAAAPTEREVQAVFLLHLARFVRWPESSFRAPDSPLVIGVLADAEMAEIVEQIVQDEQVGGRQIISRHLNTPRAMVDCHVVFIERDALPSVASLIPTLDRRPVLFVSDGDGFLNLGGHVQLFRRSGKLQLRINPDNLKSSHLAASSQLLRIARAETAGGGAR